MENEIKLIRIRILDFGVSRFPNTCEKSQVVKVKGEIKEYYDEMPYTEKWYYEKADVYISSVHCYERFGNIMCKFIIEQMEQSDDFPNLLHYIKAKMDINEQRTWKGNQHKIIKRINYKTGKITEEVLDA